MNEMGLFESVVNESYGYPNSLDSITESEIQERITDSPEDMYEFTGECMMKMLATEAAVYQIEGIQAVNYLKAQAAGDTAAMESAKIVFEGVVGDAWETLVEWLRKAYVAVKNFLIKVWNKMKGTANVVQAFFSKYGDVLRNKDASGLLVDWVHIDIEGVRPVYDRYLGVINGNEVQLGQIATQIFNFHRATPNNRASNASQDAYGQMASHNMNHRTAIDTTRTVTNPTTHYVGTTRNNRQAHIAVTQLGQFTTQMRTIVDRIPSPRDITIALKRSVYGTDQERRASRESFSGNMRTLAIEAADINSYKKYIDYFLSLGDKGLQDSLKVIQEQKRRLADSADSLESRNLGAVLQAFRRCANAKLELHRICYRFLVVAAKQMQSQSISACRKAIMYHSTKGEGRTRTEESYGYDNSYGYDTANEGYADDGAVSTIDDFINNIA